VVVGLSDQLALDAPDLCWLPLPLEEEDAKRLDRRLHVQVVAAGVGVGVLDRRRRRRFPVPGERLQRARELLQRDRVR
jgi:hypothetical protein